MSEGVLAIGLSRSSPDTLESQLYAQLRDQILAGRISGGSRLPSTRSIAKELGVSRTVPLAAYERLLAEGYLEARRGAGNFVRTLTQPPASPKTRPTLPPAPRAPTVAPEASPFARIPAASPEFPHALWAGLLARGWRREGAEAGTGEDRWLGLASLRTAIAAHVRALRDLPCGPANVFVTSGNADALAMIVKAAGPAHLPPGAEAWVEDPGYAPSRRMLSEHALVPVSVPVDRNGLDVAAGIALAPGARMAVVTPSRQFPLGMPLSLERRLALLAWASSNGAVIVEDEYDTEIRFAGRAIPSLGALDPGADVVLLGSLSNLTFPGLRLGYAIASEALVERLGQARARTEAPVATAAQPAMAEFIRSGAFSKHLGQLRRSMAARRSALVAALAERLPGAFVVQQQEVGTFLTATFTPQLAAMIADVDLARRASDHGLDLVALSPMSERAPRPQGVVMNYSSWEPAEIDAAVGRLNRLVEQVAAARSLKIRCQAEQETPGVDEAEG